MRKWREQPGGASSRPLPIALSWSFPLTSRPRPPVGYGRISDRSASTSTAFVEEATATGDQFDCRSREQTSAAPNPDKRASDSYLPVLSGLGNYILESPTSSSLLLVLGFISLVIFSSDSSAQRGLGP